MASMTSYDREFSLTGTESEDIELKIPVKSIAEYFYCPVCRCSLQEVAFTSCAHRFCTSCINEWVGRRHECPVCRAKLDKDGIVHDKQYDELIKKIISERKKAEILYYQKAAEAAASFTDKNSTNKFLSPLQSTLQKHLKQTLNTHEVYHQQVLAEFKRSQSRALRERESKIQQVMRKYPYDPNHPERVQQMKKVEEEWEGKQQSLTNELARIEALLTSAYDRYLEKNLPSPNTLPVTVNISVPERNFIANDVIIQPSDTMDHILKKVEGLMKEENIDVISFPPCEELQISLLSPFAEENNQEQDGDDDDDDDECNRGACGGGKSAKSDEGAVLTSLVHTTLHGDCRPVLEYGIKPGSEIKILGNIILRGDEPKVCFAATFVKGQSKSIDYFTCSTCANLTWICQMCADVCHKGHKLLPYKMNHVSTWPCCYCRKKKLCIISPTND